MNFQTLMQYWLQYMSSLVQEMAWCQVSAKLFLDPMINFDHILSKEQTSLILTLNSDD